MELDLTTAADVKMLMLGAKSERDWDERCDQVKAANGGDYPSFWFAEINMSGLMALVVSGWQSDSLAAASKR